MNMEIAWGTSKSWSVLLKDQDDELVDGTGKTLKLMAKRKLTDADSAAVFALENGSGIVFPGEFGNHSARIDLEPEHTDALTPSVKTTLHYQFLLIDGDDRYEVSAGNFIVKPSVIQT